MGNLFQSLKGEALGAFWKTRRRDIVLCFLLFLISTISFGLGYLFAREADRTPIVIEKHSPQ